MNKHVSQVISALVSTFVLAHAAGAGPVSFLDWKQHWFARFADVDFAYSSSALGVTATDAVSITYAKLPAQNWAARSASWRWSVDQSVPATDLRQKGGDDRNLALYFAFLPKEDAADAGRKSLRRLLNHPEGRVLVYVWGGDHGRGSVLPSPYLGARGKTVVLRPSGTGAHNEAVDLAADYARAFGDAPGALVALAVSSDSDDTNAVAKGAISNLRLQ